MLSLVSTGYDEHTILCVVEYFGEQTKTLSYVYLVICEEQMNALSCM